MIESIRIDGAGEDAKSGLALQIGRTSQHGRIDVGVLRQDGTDAWVSVEIADVLTALQSLSATAPRPIQKEARS